MEDARPVQNIYDNPVFFEGYRKVWSKPNPYNDGIEQPALLSLLPAPDRWRGLKVLDLGCGTGRLSFPMAQGGAAVKGVDVSERMLEVARARLAQEEESNLGAYGGRLTFERRSIEECCASQEDAEEDGTYDVVVAGLVMHYIRDIEPVLRRIERWLKPGGVLVFSTEHPIASSAQGVHPPYLKQGGKAEAEYFIYDNYHMEGLRKATWIVEGVERYHRTMASWVNGLIDAGLVVDRMLEPRPSAEALVAFPELKSFDTRRPIFLCIRARKPSTA